MIAPIKLAWLAKLKGDAGAVSPLSQMPTQDASAPLTAEGTIIGTLQYMAPEQLEGKEAGARTDIFAFGAVVYEVVTGKKAFEGASQASLIGAIMNSEPQQITELQPVSPPALGSTLSHCLSKTPDDRWHSASDLVFHLKEISLGGERDAIQGKSDRAQRPQKAWVTAVACLSIFLAGSATMWVFLPAASPSVEWLTILPPNSTSGVAPEPIVSPDGQSIIFRARNDSGVITLWEQSFDSPSQRELPGTEEAYLPFFSSDGRSVSSRLNSTPH